MKHRTWIELNKSALENNIQSLRSLLERSTAFCAVLKANAYGHGLLEMAQLLNQMNVTHFAVDNIDEGMLLRAHLPEAHILVLGYTLKERFLEALEHNLELVVYDLPAIKKFEELTNAKKLVANIHLKIETGTYRQGIFPSDLRTISDMILSCAQVNLTGVCTHFATIEEAEGAEYAAVQLRIFEESVEALKRAGHTPNWIHSACSAGIILYPQTHGTLVRSGIALYGIWPSESTRHLASQHAMRCDLRPVLSWKTRIAQIKSVPAGTAIGYGLSEMVKRQSRIAVIPVGYSDGYDRKLSSEGEVLIAGHRCKIIGRVCMNMCMVDVSFVPNVELEQEVILLGETGRTRIPVERLAAWTQTIPYEVLSRINPLIPRLIAPS